MSCQVHDIYSMWATLIAGYLKAIETRTTVGELTNLPQSLEISLTGFSKSQIYGVAESKDDSCRVGVSPALKYKGRARCPSHKTSKIIPQICNAKYTFALPKNFSQTQSFPLLTPMVAITAHHLGGCVFTQINFYSINN